MRLDQPARLRTRLAADDGFSMLAVMLAMIVTAIFVAAGYAASNGDLRLSRNSQDRKVAYAAAEAGLSFYRFNLDRDNDYWTRCTNVPAPNPSEASPVNQKWNGIGSDPRRWRKLPGSQAEYTIELLPAGKSAKCVEGDQASMLDPASGTFRIRVTGRPSAGSSLRRTINATFRRNSFLDFLYFTDYETLDPMAYSSNGAWAATYCADRYRAARNSGCTEIQFADFDEINGPLHTNDDLLVCDTPVFGRNAGDRIEVSGPAPGYKKVCGSGDPVFNAPLKSGVPQLAMPTTNTTLASVAAKSGYTFTGKTTIRFNASGKELTVENAALAGGKQDLDAPLNGVIYVKNGICGTSIPPIVATYTEPVGCAQVYVSGTYRSSMTIASDSDIIVKSPTGTTNGNLLRSGDAVLGLIANNYVRVYHKVDRTKSPCANVDTTAEPLVKDYTIEAAILSLQHSFIVDNWNCGGKLNTLAVKGAIAQKYRGPVGVGGASSSGSGFAKKYDYDDRLRFRSPPYFLDPVAASWRVIRSNEQVPAV